MKNILKRLLSSVLCLAMLLPMLPTSVLAANDTPDKLELTDGYLKVSVSGKNGGFLIDTVEGDKLDKADNNKNLLYPAADYDTSYTSFRVTRSNGKTEEYIFGRTYGFLGLSTRRVELTQEGNSIVATWGVKDLTVTQTLTLLDETASLHGMVNIGYTVSSTGDDITDVKMRVMYDTALGFQDYATYEVPNRLNEYTHVIKDTVISNSGEDLGDNYSGTLFAVDDANSPTLTAYTVDAVVDGTTVAPYQLAFGHWNNLASSVFDFVPRDIDFTNPYNKEYMTADSAYALYYDLGAVSQDAGKSFSTYYGIYSNATLNDEETVVINFPVMPSAMVLKEGDSNAYYSQVTDGSDGDIQLKMMLENISGKTYDEVTVVVETMNDVYPYEDYLYFPDKKGAEAEPLTEVVTQFKAGEELVIDAYFNVKPLVVSEYRKFKVLCYNTTEGDELTDARLVGSREFYLFCPGELGETIVFNSIDPSLIYYEGTRNIYLSGLNFGLLQDTTIYSAVLHPVDGNGTDVVVPGTNIVVDTSNGTINLVVDEQMQLGTYQVIFDWVEEGKEDATSDLLRFQVTDDLTKVSSTYGVVTVEKDDDFTEDNPTYKIGMYRDERSYQNSLTEKERNNKVYLEFRGNFGIRRENGEVVEVRANSLTDVKGNPLSTINISNCLDVECGTVALTVENPGEENQVINIDIDGKVYTTNARTSVWDGVCAITPFANGELSTMLEYDYEGNACDGTDNSVGNTNAITLLWPGAASAMQTIAGMFFEFRYCQFGFLALEDSDAADARKLRIISFGAELSPDFLLPSNFNWGERETSTMEVAQLALAKKNYTADQLRDVQERFANDQQKFLDAQRGTLNLYVNDILFGGGFAGFNTTIEVSLPEYFNVLPSVEGTLDLKVLPATMYRDGRVWEFGVAGSADLIMIQLEASFRMKETPAGAPAVDEFYAYVEGGFPGINIDGVGCFWIVGLGGGVSNIYDTMFVLSEIPPMALAFTSAFRIYQVLEAKASMKASLRGFEVSMKDISIARVNLIDELGFSAYWYPKLSLRANMYVNVLNIISGGGYIVVEENVRDNDLFVEAFARASVKTPRIGLIPSITVGSVDLGINSNKMWGALHVLKLDMGVTYYWGGDVDFAFGKYDSPEPTYPLATMAVGTDPDTGRVLYMDLGTNARMLARSGPAMYGSLRGSSNASINSSVDSMTHVIDLGTYDTGKDMLLSFTFSADSEKEAELIAKGNGLTRKGITLASEDGTVTYGLQWVDNDKPVDEQPNTNALFVYDEETKEATVTISFTESEAYSKKWVLTSDVETVLGLYELEKLPGLDSVTYSVSGNQVTIDSLTGYDLAAFGEVNVFAVNPEGLMYPLGTVDAENPSAKALDLPTDLPSDTYGIRVIGSNEEENVCASVDADDIFTHVNPLQPEAPTVSSVKLGGDYSIDVSVQSSDSSVDGYLATIYEKNGNAWVPVEDFSDMIVEATDGVLPEVLTVGGRYTTTSYVDGEGNPISRQEAENNSQASAVETTHALEAGKTYAVGVAAYSYDENGVPVYSGETMSAGEVTMTEPAAANVTVQAQGAKTIPAVIDPEAADGTPNTIDVVTANKVSFQITSDMPVSGSWSLNGGAQSGDWSATNNGIITLTEDVAEGEHMLTLWGENENGDGFRTQYRFRMDSSGPLLQISAPVNGQSFGGTDGDYAKETVNVTGRSEPGAQIIVELEGVQAAKTVVDKSGSFDIPVELDETQLRQTLTVYGVDTAGNETTRREIGLNNAITGAEGVYLGIFLDGNDVTNKTIPAGTVGELDIRFVAGDRSVAIPDDSQIGRQIEWSVSMVSGSASVEDVQLFRSRAGLGSKRLFSDGAAHGLLRAEYGAQSATAVLGSNQLRQSNKVTLPTGEGYTVETEDALIVPYDEDFTFTVKFAEGYSATENFAVTVNGAELTPENGVYTIKNVHAPKTVEVSGVADITAPDTTISVAQNNWKTFLNTITFGLFFKQTQTVTITAEDAGTGVASVAYHVSDSALTEDGVRALGSDAWTAYSAPFDITPNGKYVVYVKVRDNAFNVAYISSDGMILKNTAPVISGVKNGETYYGDQIVTVTDPHLDSVKLDGQTVALTNGQLTVPADNARHTIKAVDKAGNVIAASFSVYKIYTVTFMADQAVVDMIPVKHGESVTGNLFPQIPAKTGYTQVKPRWDPATLTNVTSDVTVSAVYTPDVYKVLPPADPVGYTVIVSGQEVTFGQSATFTVEIAEGYSAKELSVKANGVEIEPAEGIYTIPAVTENVQITVSGVVDMTAPKTQIAVDANAWKEFLHTITFGLFFNKTQNVTITAEDAGSGVEAVAYFVSDKALTLEEVKAMDDWSTYTGKFGIVPDAQVVIYAKASDHAGNVSYISSDGIVLDSVIPSVVGIEDGGTYEGEVTVKVSDTSIESITVNGKKVYPGNQQNGGEKETSFVLSPAEGKQVVEITDRAGNKVTYTVTVNAPAEEPTEGPSNTPETGDSGVPQLWLTLLILSALGAALVYVINKKKTCSG